MIFQVEAQGDTMYIEAASQDAAQARLFDFTGPIPTRLLKWTVIGALPEGEELL